MNSYNLKETPRTKVFSLLLGAVGPRPIAFASTLNEKGEPNLSPFSFFNVFSSNPPVCIFSPARRGRDNTTKDTLENVKRIPEVVINMVNFSIVQQMSLSSTEYPTGVNEFIKSGLTPIPSETIKPFRVKESPVQMECKVREIIPLGENGGAGNLVICDILMVHVNENIFNENGVIDPQKIDLVGRMGADWYCRAFGDSIFEVKKPVASLGIGVDSIPEPIRNSPILSGNDLGILGNVEGIPDETEVNEYRLMELSDLFVLHENNKNELETQLHILAKQKIKENKVEEAWKSLLSFNY